MTLQNRVTPLGEIVATPERGAFTGNRGIIHDAATHSLLTRRWTNRAWLICVLHWRDRQREVMGRGWTELFFLDEATALAAGHRPCFYCRREAARSFQAAFPMRGLKAPEIDRILHEERLEGRGKRLHTLPTPAADLPDGAMILQDAAPYLILKGMAHPWSFSGYGAPTAPLKEARLITPPSIVEALRAGFHPQIDESAIV